LAGETHPGAALQDILRLLTLWFNHGSAPDVEAALQEGFGHVSIDTWLVVIPQVNPLFYFLFYHCRLAWVAFASKPLRLVICADGLLPEVPDRELRSCAHLVDKDWQQTIDTSALHEGLSHVPVYPDADVRCSFCFSCHHLLYNVAQVMCLLILTLT